MENIKFNEMSNSEIEIRIKSLEFEYEKVKNEIYERYDKLDYLNKNYLLGKTLLEKRLNKKIC